jgi:hypothetical protein
MKTDVVFEEAVSITGRVNGIGQSAPFGFYRFNRLMGNGPG